MGWARVVAASAMCAALSGCGTAFNPEETAPDTTPHGSVPQTLLPPDVEKERAETAFEKAFRTHFMEPSDSRDLRETTIRFRTPCHGAQPYHWYCEGWARNASDACFVATATVSGTGVVGVLQSELWTKSMGGDYVVCSEGGTEGRPFGDLTPEA